MSLLVFMRSWRIPSGLVWVGFAMGTVAGAEVGGKPLSLPGSGRDGFTLMDAARTGVTFTNVLVQSRHLTNQIFLNGSGVAAGDVDGNGWCDLYFCGLDSDNALYLNQGDWRFREAARPAGVACSGQESTGALLADLDGDRDLDLLVNSVGKGTRVFLNDSRGHFVERTITGRLNAGRGGMSMALGDVEGDGDLDLYIANYRTVTIRDQPNTKFNVQVIDGEPVVTSINDKPLTDPAYTNRFDFQITLTQGRGRFSHDERGEPDVLLLNDGLGNFVPVSFVDGRFLDAGGRPLTSAPLDWGLSVMFRDLNEDLAPDLYVCNDFKSVDRIWLNRGDGRFQAAPPLMFRQTSLSSMGADVADIDRDGDDDLVVLDMLSADHYHRLTQRTEMQPEQYPPGSSLVQPQTPRNTLHLNRGDGTYVEMAQYAGLEASDWSWTPAFLDVDLDGYEDLLVANGFERDGMNVDTLRRLESLKNERSLEPIEQLRLRAMFPRLTTPSAAFRNLGRGRFEPKGQAWGFDAPVISHGLALADLDNDGDLDVALNNFNALCGLYRNESHAPRVAVRLKGQAPNTGGIGAKMRLAGGPVPQQQEIMAGGRYLSSDEPMRVFAAGAGPMTIEVAWRSGRRSRLDNARPNHLYEIEEPRASAPATSPPATNRIPWFVEVSLGAGLEHRENTFNDFERQPMLSHNLSQPGPGVAWFDIDQDGWEDLVIGSGAGGAASIFNNNGEGGFDPWPHSSSGSPWPRDQTGIVIYRDASGVAKWVTGVSNYEDGGADGDAATIYDFVSGNADQHITGQSSSTGPLAMADWDGDGDLDLFIGGRAVPGRYPEPASSLFYRNEHGRFEVDKAQSEILGAIGNVQGAVFSDVDGDNDPDLVLACHWGPVKVLRNDGGSWIDATKAMGLDSHLGWWNSVAGGDFDGDGRLDLVAGNWGRNTRFERFRQPVFSMMAGDLDGNGTVETIEAYRRPALDGLWPVQPMHVVMRAYPLVGAVFSTCDAYARADVQAIYGDALKRAVEYQINWPDTTVFLNRGSRFEAVPLPEEAQWSPAFAVCVADLDGDGHEDVFLSQNFFAVHPELSRYDAGRGLWLRGNGRGGFLAVAGQESGLLIYGEQRGAAVADYDADGRVDLVVAQNAEATRLYRNARARPGLRVRLRGPSANPFAVGAWLRWVQDSKQGPIKEIQAGSGYLSQNSFVPVLAPPEGALKLWVRWPGGAETLVEVPVDAVEVALDPDGKLERLR